MLDTEKKPTTTKKIPKRPLPHTQTLLCSSDMKIAVLRQASQRARHCKDGTQLWRQVLPRGTKNESHSFSFACEKSRKFINIMEKSQRAHHPGRLACIYTVSHNASLFLFHKYEASGKNYPISLKGREKTIIQENPALSPSPTPFKKLVCKYWRCRDACRSILVPKAGIRGLCSSPSVTLASTTMP